MSETVSPQDTVPEVPLESTAEGEGDDNSQIKLDQLNEMLGRDYKDVDTALKSVKETFSFVGKRDELRQNVEDVMKKTGADEQTVLTKLQTLMSEETPTPEATEEKPQVTPDDIRAELTARYEEDRFFDKNPDFESVKEYVKPLKQQEGFKDMSWSEFAETEQAQKLVETFSGYQEANSKKSVVESNPKIGAMTDKLSKAREAQQSGDDQTAKSNALSAVMDSFDE